MHRELFFDLSTVSTGYAIYDNGAYLASGVIRQEGKDGLRRAAQMLNSIDALLIAYQPDCIIPEKLPPMSHRGQELSIYLHGGLKFLAIRREIDLTERSTPSHWRKVLGFDQSKGANSTASAKQQSLMYASTIAGRRIMDDNEADAICLGAAHCLEKEQLTDAATQRTAKEKRHAGRSKSEKATKSGF